MKKMLCSMALLLAASSAFGQDKFIRQAQAFIEQNKLTEAQTAITEALTSGKTKKNGFGMGCSG